VTVEEDPTLLTFTFPEGSVLEVGQTYTITVQMRFRPGLTGQTQVTNTTGISGDRAWDECVETLSADNTECSADTTVAPIRGGALRSTKAVRAAVGDGLGVLNTSNRPDGCTPTEGGSTPAAASRSPSRAATRSGG